MLVAWGWLAAAAAELALDPTPRWLDQPRVLAAGAHQLQLGEGWLFPIRSDDRALFGFVFVGPGRIGLPIRAGGERLRLRAALGDPVGETESADVLLVVSADPDVTGFVEALPGATGDRVPGYVDEQGVEHVLVTAARPERARALARRSFARRLAALAEVGLDPGAMLDQEPHLASHRLLAEARPVRSWLPVARSGDTTALGEVWITLVSDPLRAVDDRYADLVAVHAAGVEGRQLYVVGGRPPEGPAEGLRAEGIVENVVIASGGGVALDASFEAVVRLTADRPTRLLDLWLPAYAPEPLNNVVVAPPRFEAGPIELDGEPVQRLAPWGRSAHSDGRLQTVVLPEPIGPGQQATLRVRWRERWAAARIVDFSPFQKYELGRVHVALDVAPRLGGPPAEAPVELRVGTTLGKRWRAVLPGMGEAVRSGDGRLWIGRAEGPATVAFGQLRERVARPGPQSAIWSHDLYAELTPGQVADVVSFYRDRLPPAPLPAFVQASRDPASMLHPPPAPPRVTAGYGGLHVLRSFREIPPEEPPGPFSAMRAMASIAPNHLERTLASALAADRWLDRPHASADDWLAAAVPAVCAARYAAARLPERHAERWAAREAEVLADVPDRPLLPWTWHGGAWVEVAAARMIGGALAERIGEEALWSGLRSAMASGRRDAAGLAEALEEASGVPLGGWFDTWAVAGLRPEIEGDCRSGPDGLYIELRADPLVGRYELPLVFGAGADREVRWIEMIDGHGAIEIPDAGARPVAIDPDGWLPLRERALSCE